MSLTKKVFYNTSAQFIGKILNTILGLVSVAVITRYLGVSGYGDYTTAFAYIMFFSVISDFGFFWVIVRKISIGEQIEKVIHNAQTLRLIFAAVVILAALVIAGFLPYSYELKIAVSMVAISILWSGQNSVYLALFQSQLRMDFTVIAETVGRALSVSLVILAIYLNLGFLYIVAAGLSATLFNYFFNLIFSLKYCRFGFGWDKKIMKEILFHALPIGVVTILSLIYFKIDTVLLSVLRESTDVGVYGTAYKILEILMALPIMFVGMIFPALSEAFHNKDSERLNKLIQKSFDALSIGALAISSLFFIYAKPVIALVAGSEFVETATITIKGNPVSADTVLQVLVIAVGINFFNALFTNLLISFDMQKKLIMPYVVASVFNVVTNLILIPRYSYLAAAGTTVITELIILVLTYIIASRLSEINLRFKTLVKCILAVLVVVCISLVTRSLPFYVSGIFALVGYAGTLYITKTFNKETIKAMVGR